MTVRHQVPMCACPNPDCNSARKRDFAKSDWCRYCQGKGKVQEWAPQSLYKTVKSEEHGWRSERSEPGFEFIGIGEESFRKQALAMLEMVGLTGAISCGFVGAWAFVQSGAPLYSCLSMMTIRKTPAPWSPQECVDHLWAWLEGQAPKGLLLPDVGERECYFHTPESGAVYPPPMGSQFDHQDPYEHKGYAILNLRGIDVEKRGVGISVAPIWVYDSQWVRTDA